MTPERFQKIKDILNKRQPDLTVIMDNVHKPHNLAAIIRSCDAV
ncbi:MAG TPA: tRNA (guanosine(18)-2'-O)-methyltransferase TrmH, partial [Candidatus Marinimicrobia bacterium]|nr:tRNA (guanosine(18)-2'-O)-methyltransferase TrmH [Candidatus Neomarinimicrobiota bacterium]